VLALALVLAAASAVAVNWGYVREQDAAAALPPLSIRRPRESATMLLTNRRWVTGFATETAGFFCFVGALALAPLALVQSLAAGGLAILAFLAARVRRRALELRERVGVAVAVLGLALLGISLAGGVGDGSNGSPATIAVWLAVSGVVAAVALRAGSGASHGVAAGVLFAGGDVATKAAVAGGVHVAFVPALIAAYLGGTAVLQRGFQKGGALATAGVATLLTNALPVIAGTTVFAEPLPDGALGVLRVAAFILLVLGGVALARMDSAREPEPVAALV
jgi:hypothetical protein